MSEHKDIRQIERDLERDRADLAQSLEALRSSLTFGGLMGQGARLVEEGYASLKDQGARLVEAGREIVSGSPAENGAPQEGVPGAEAAALAGAPAPEPALGPLGQGLGAAVQLVKDHPLAATAASAGLGWVVKKLGDPGRGDPAPAVDQRLADLFAPGADSPGEDEVWMAEADRLRARAADLLELLDEAESRADLAPDAIARRRDEVQRSLAYDTRRVMMHGIEGLEGAARDKAFRRREAMYARHLGHEAGGGWVKPVAVGTLVAGTGLVLAMVLPRGASEAKVLGEMRSRVVDEVGGFMKANPGLSSVVTTRVVGGLLSALMRRL